MTIDSLLDKFLWPYVDQETRIEIHTDAKKSFVDLMPNGGYNPPCINLTPGLTEQEYEALIILFSAHILYTPSRIVIVDSEKNDRGVMKEVQLILDRFRVIAIYKQKYPQFVSEIHRSARLMMYRWEPKIYTELIEDAIHILMDEPDLVTKKQLPDVVDKMLAFGEKKIRSYKWVKNIMFELGDKPLNISKEI